MKSNTLSISSSMLARHITMKSNSLSISTYMLASHASRTVLKAPPANKRQIRPTKFQDFTAEHSRQTSNTKVQILT